MRSLGSASTNTPSDILQFQRGYPDQPNDRDAHANLDFYRNVKAMRPDGLKYEDWMNKNETDWQELEYNHGFIQWLFPIPEQGVNYQAQPLHRHEMEAMSLDEEILDRILRSYQMMLAFYGIAFNGGKLRLVEKPKPHLNNLSSNSHNLLRITRILKHVSLFPRFQPHAAPLVLFFAALHSDGYINLSSDRMHGQSLERFWAGCFRDISEKEEVKAIVMARGKCREGKWGLEKWAEWYDANRGSESQDGGGEEEDISERTLVGSQGSEPSGSRGKTDQAA